MSHLQFSRPCQHFQMPSLRKRTVAFGDNNSKGKLGMKHHINCSRWSCIRWSRMILHSTQKKTLAIHPKYCRNKKRPHFLFFENWHLKTQNGEHAGSLKDAQFNDGNCCPSECSARPTSVLSISVLNAETFGPNSTPSSSEKTFSHTKLRI